MRWRSMRDLAGEGGAFDHQREVAFAAPVMAGVADVLRALVLEVEPGGAKAPQSSRSIISRATGPVAEVFIAPI